MEFIKVVIIDDYQLSALGAQALVQQDANIKVIGIFNNGKDALQFVKNNKPDVVLLDIMMPEPDGFEVLHELRLIYDDIKVIMLTISDSKVSIIKSFALKANGFIFKDVTKDEIINAIKKVNNNEFAYSSRIFDIIIDDLIDIFGNQKIHLEYHDQLKSNQIIFKKDYLSTPEIQSLLTQREYEIFRMIGDGMSSKDLSEQLNLSKFTVNAYRKNILAKLRIKNIKSLFHKLEIERNQLKSGSSEILIP
jgi:DNA-binding NarL/FixJ family response regulator